MNKKILTTFLVLIMIIAGLGVINAEVKNPETFTYLTTGNQDTLDPHFSYDTASNEIIYQVYENLIAYDGESVDEFKPLLAKRVPTKENGLISEDGTEYTFELREGIEFSNGNDLTPEDVKYSFMRAMVFDRTGGPSWTVLKPLVDVKSLSELTNELVGIKKPGDLTTEQSKKVYEKLDKNISINGHKITFHLVKPYPPFLNIIAKGMTSTSILDKEWSVKQGAWDGKAETIGEYHDPLKEDDPLYDVMMGTGPFILEEWENGEHVILKRNDNYWREPANFETAIIRTVDEFSTRRLLLKRGDADMIYVSPSHISQFKKNEDVTVNADFPVLQNTVGIMNWEINTKGNEYIGSGKLDGEGIPADFFSDKNIRKAFSYAFNYESFIDKVARGHGSQSRGPIPSPLLGFDKDSKVYSLNLEKAEEHFKKAFDGKVWEKGFELTVLYNSGNGIRKTAADMVKTYVEKINSKFKVNTRGIQWSTYINELQQGRLPMNFIGWAGQFADPHTFVVPYMTSDGTFGRLMGENYQDWAKENTDSLVKEGINTVNRDKREEIYKEIQKKAIENATVLWIYQPTGINVRRSSIKGWYSNPTRSVIDIYPLDK